MLSDQPATSARAARLAVLASLTTLLVAVVAVWKRLQNDAFVDEATYIVAGRLLLHGKTTGQSLPPFATYFSGAPFLYPPIAALADAWGGLAAARLVSLLAVVGAALALHVATRRLFDDRAAGVAASALFLWHAPTLLLAKLATYDAPAVLMLGVALACAIAAGDAGADGRAWRRGAVAGIAAGLAVGIKYASLLYVPVLGVVPLVVRPIARGQVPRRLVPAVALLATAVATISVVLLWGGVQNMLAGFAATTMTRPVPTATSAGDVLTFAALLGGAVACLALPTVLAPAPSTTALVLALLIAGIAAPLNHARIHESVSLHKHVAFGTLFLAPAAGRSVARGGRAIVEHWRDGSEFGAFTIASLATVVLAWLVVIPAVDGSRQLYRYWSPETAAAYRAMRPAVHAGGHYLSEEPDLGAYYLPATKYGDWSHPYYLAVRANAGAGTPPVAAYVARVDSGYFDAVVLRFAGQRRWALPIDSALRVPTSHYHRVASLLFALADGVGVYDVWLRAP